MIATPYFFLILTFLLFISINLVYSRDAVEEFSQTLYSQQMYLVDIQNKAVLKSLIEKMQHETWVLNLLSRFKTKVISGEVTFNDDFRKPLLNILQTYHNIGDHYLMDQFKQNKTILISSWHQKDAMYEKELDKYQLDQINNASRADFLWKSALTTNRLRIQTEPKFKTFIEQYFYAYMYDGMYYSSGNNFTFQNVIDKPCLSGKYHFDTRCKEYFVASRNASFVAGYPPMVFYGGTENKPYTSCGLCKKIYYPSYQKEQYKDLFKNKELNLFSIVCNSVQMQLIKFVFEKVGDENSLKIMVDPNTFRLAYQSDYQMKRDEVVLINDTYLYRIEDQEQKERLISKIKSFYFQKMIKKCSFDRQYIFKLSENVEREEFSFYQDGKEMICIFEISFTIDRNYVKLPNGEQQIQYCYVSNLLFMSIMSKDQLRFQAIILEDNINTLEIVFRSTIYLSICLSIYIAYKNIRKISSMLNAPVEHLTSILKKLRVDEETKNYILFEDGMLTGEFQIESSELFLSSDTYFLYESFQNLFQTLIFTTQQIYNENECQTLIQLNKQIGYFKQFRNYRALGICYNNIGNIHLNNYRFFESLENYQMAIVYCNYELNQYDEGAYSSKNNLSESSEFKKILSQGEFYNSSERISFDTVYNRRQKKKERLSFVQSFKKLLASKSLLPQNQQTQQESLMKCFQKYGMETSQKSQVDKTEIYWMLFNRKFNYFKALYFLMTIQTKTFSDWTIAETLVQELKSISQYKLPSSHKRNIILNQAAIYVYQQKNEIEKSKQIIQENDFHFEQIKLQKEQQMIQNYLKPQKTPLNKSIQLNNTHFTQQDNQQYSQQNLYSFTQNFQSQLLNTPVLTPKVSYNSYKPNFQGSFSYQKPTQIPLHNTNNQNVHLMQQYQKQKYFNKKQVGFNPKENLQQSLLNSPLQQKKSQPNLYYKNIRNKMNPTLNMSSYLDDINYNGNYDQQSPLQHILSTPVEDSFSVLNPSHSPLQSMPQQQQNLLDSLKEEISSKKKQNSTSQFMGKSSTGLLNTPQLHFPKHIYDWINDKQKKKKKRKQSKNDDEETCNSKMSQKNSFSHNMKDNQIHQNTEYSHRSKKNRKNTFNFKSNKSQNKLVVEYNSDEIMPYEFKDEALNGIILEQISIFYTMIGDYFKAAETLTKYFEESQTIIPCLSYRCFQKLFGIFSQYQLSHPQLESENHQFNSDISFKINFVYFSWVDNINNNNEKKKIDTSFSSHQNSINSIDQQIENESDCREQRLKGMIFCESLINDILYKNDDYFGLITSNIDDMSIKENITIMSKKLIDNNMNLIKKELYDYFDSAPIIFKLVDKKSIEQEVEPLFNVGKKSHSLQLDKKRSSPSKKHSKIRGTCIISEKVRQSSPKSFTTYYSSQQNLYEKRRDTSNGKYKKRNQIQNNLLQNYHQIETLNRKQSSSKSISDSNMQNSKNRLFKNHQSPNINLNSTKLNQTQDKQSNVISSQSYMFQVQQNGTINIYNNSFQAQNNSNNINNNFNLNDQNNSNYMMSYSNINKSSNLKSLLITLNQEKTCDLLDKPLEFIESPKSLNQIPFGSQTPLDLVNSLINSQNPFNQKESIHINLDGSIESLEKEQLSPIVEEVSRRNIHQEDQKKLQKLTLYSSADFNKLTVKKSEPVLHTFTNWVNNFKETNKMELSTSNNMEKQANQAIPFKKIPESEKKQFLPIQQIQLNEQDNKQNSLIDLQSQLMYNKKKLFYYTIRKALQQVTCQHESKSLLIQLNKIQIENSIKSKLSCLDRKKQEKLNKRCNKMYFIKNNIPEQRHYNKCYKKFIVAVIDDLKMIDQNESLFKILTQNLKILEVELCLLCQNEELSIKEGTEYSSIIIEDKCVISFFHSEKNLLLYLMNSRSQKNHNCIPLIVEHF